MNVNNLNNNIMYFDCYFDKEKKLWNEAVAATLIELRKYDGIIKETKDIEYMTQEIFKKVAYKGFPHKFKKIKFNHL